jgi:putative transposase
MVSLIDEHRATYGVEPICTVLPMAPSTYHACKQRRADPSLRSARAKRDEALSDAIRQIHKDSFWAYGAPKVWRELHRQGTRTARCTVERLMRDLGLRGVRRGQRVRTTVGDDAAVRPLDLVQRDFTAERPNRSWVADFTYISTWVGFVYVAFVVDVFSRGIVGWRLSPSLTTDFVLDALEQAIHAHRPKKGLIHRSDQRSQCPSNRYSERLSDEGIAPWVGSVADS